MEIFVSQSNSDAKKKIKKRAQKVLDQKDKQLAGAYNKAKKSLRDKLDSQTKNADKDKTEKLGETYKDSLRKLSTKYTNDRKAARAIYEKAIS